MDRAGCLFGISAYDAYAAGDYAGPYTLTVIKVTKYRFDNELARYRSLTSDHDCSPVTERGNYGGVLIATGYIDTIEGTFYEILSRPGGYPLYDATLIIDVAEPEGARKGWFTKYAELLPGPLSGGSSAGVMEEMEFEIHSGSQFIWSETLT